MITKNAREDQATSPPGGSHSEPVAAVVPSPASPAQLLERIEGATCTYHGLGSEAERQGHINAIVATLMEAQHGK